MTRRKIDIYNHVAPARYLDLLRQMAPAASGLIKRISAIPVLYDMEARVRMLDRWPGYEQVITISNPPVETMVSPADSVALVRLGNDEMRSICLTRPDKFLAWVANLPLGDVDASLEEMDRVIALGAKGIQLYSNINGLPLDRPEFFPLFERAAAHHKVPIWLHPTRTANHPDYLDEAESKYEIWNVFGWPYETSVAMARMVFGGFFDALPELRVITHHLGAMIPFFEGRVGPNWDKLGVRSVGNENSIILERMCAAGRRPIDYFRLFYADTAVGGSSSAIRCGLDFFGEDHVIFGTDCPFDPLGGTQFVSDTIAAIDGLALPEAALHKIYCGNALCMLGFEDHATIMEHRNNRSASDVDPI